MSNDISNTKLGLVKWNNGIGLAVQTPLGPARIDYAFQTKNLKFGKIQWEFRIFFEFLEHFNFFNIKKTKAFWSLNYITNLNDFLRGNKMKINKFYLIIAAFLIFSCSKSPNELFDLAENNLKLDEAD